MPDPRQLDEARSRARRTIETIWRDIARSYTLGWGGPIDVVERDFPFIGNAILSIRSQITRDLPVLFFQSRESPPKNMLAAVPYVDDTGNPFNCRLAAVRNITKEEIKLYGDFAQAFWFCVNMKMLPDPREHDNLEAALIEWTGEKLIRL